MSLNLPLPGSHYEHCLYKFSFFFLFLRFHIIDIITPILWPPDAKGQLIRKDLDAGKDWRQEEKGTTENEMVGRHHQPNGHEFEQTPGDGEGQPGMLQSMGSQRVGHDLATKQQQQYNIFSSTHFRIILFHCHFIYFYFLNPSYDLPSPFTLYILLLSSVLKFRTSGDFFLLFSHEVVSDSLYPHGL